MLKNIKRNLRTRWEKVGANGCYPLTLLVLALMPAQGLAADELILRNGSRLIGEVGRKENGTLGFKTSFAGTIKVKWSEVSELRSENDTLKQVVAELMLKNRMLKKVRRVWNKAGVLHEVQPGERSSKSSVWLNSPIGESAGP